MFAGTNIKFKILYFFTSMIPAYFLFLTQLLNNFEGVSRNIFRILFLLLVIFGIIAVILLKKRLSNSVNIGYTNSFDFRNRKQTRNGDVISFLLGVIFPSVFTFSNNIKLSILIFLIIQILIYNLMIRSSDVFPNIIMILFGMDIYHIDKIDVTDPEYVITFNINKLVVGYVTRIGDDDICNTYIFRGDIDDN